MRQSEVWRPASTLAWREWDGELVVYNDEDGNTHLLGPLGTEVLQALLANDRAMETTELIHQLERQYGAIIASSSQVEGALEDLARLGLIGRAPD